MLCYYIIILYIAYYGQNQMVESEKKEEKTHNQLPQKHINGYK